MQSSAELVNEIATLEVEILRLERYLLSLYRTNFQHHLPIALQNQNNGETTSVQSSQKIHLGISKDYNDPQFQNSPTSSLAGPNDSEQLAIQKSSSGRVDIPTYLFPLLTLFF